MGVLLLAMAWGSCPTDGAYGAERRGGCVEDDGDPAQPGRGTAEAPTDLSGNRLGGDESGCVTTARRRLRVWPDAENDHGVRRWMPSHARCGTVSAGVGCPTARRSRVEPAVPVQLHNPGGPCLGTGMPCGRRGGGRWCSWHGGYAAHPHLRVALAGEVGDVGRGSCPPQGSP